MHASKVQHSPHTACMGRGARLAKYLVQPVLRTIYGVQAHTLSLSGSGECP